MLPERPSTVTLTEPQRRRNRVAILTRHHPDSAELIADARRELAAAKLEDYIRRVVDGAPPLTPGQRDRLAILLRGGLSGTS